MLSENRLDLEQLSQALSAAGKDKSIRCAILDALREAESRAMNAADFQQKIRWPILLALLGANPHVVTLSNGLAFEVTTASRIEKSLLLSESAHPDHVWEPQTTKLLVKLAAQAKHSIIGGAYIGDHAIPMARATRGQIHAFEPMTQAFTNLSKNISLNNVENIVANKLCLWDESNCSLILAGPEALASAQPANPDQEVSSISSITIDDYIRERGLPSVEVIMLDTEGGEERALLGARSQLERAPEESPEIVFEVHRNFVDWSNGLERTEPAKLLLEHGYEIFAIRDIQGNLQMTDQPIEVIPIASVHLEGPPHGFNLFATKKHMLVDNLGLELVKNVSPKLILEKDPSLHHPRKGWPASSSGR